MSTTSSVTEFQSSEAIGDYITVNSQEDEFITVECEDGVFEGVVRDSPDSVPTKLGETKELLCEPDENGVTHVLFAEVLEVGMRMAYDVYAVRFDANGEPTSLGVINSIRTE